MKQTIGNMYIYQIFLFLGVALANDKKKNKFFFLSQERCSKSHSLQEARLVAYASLKKFSKYTYCLVLEPKFLQNHYPITPFTKTIEKQIQL